MPCNNKHNENKHLHNYILVYAVTSKLDLPLISNPCFIYLTKFLLSWVVMFVTLLVCKYTFFSRNIKQYSYNVSSILHYMIQFPCNPGVTNNNNVRGVRVLFKGQLCPSLLSAPRHISLLQN